MSFYFLIQYTVQCLHFLSVLASSLPSRVLTFHVFNPFQWQFCKKQTQHHSYLLVNGWYSPDEPASDSCWNQQSEEQSSQSNGLLFQLLACNRGISQHWLKHLAHLTHRMTQRHALCIFSLVQSCNASAEVETSYGAEAGQMWSMRLSSSCGWSVNIRHQSDRGVALCMCVCFCVCRRW